MNCNDCLPLLDAYTDGELDLVRHMEIEDHLRTCPACARRVAGAQALKGRVRAVLPRFKAPDALRGAVRASLQKAASAAAEPRVIAFPASRSPWRAAGLAASVAAALLAGFAWGDYRGRSGALMHEAFAEHARSLQASHLMDVASTDRHTVKPWFAGKLEFSPPVVDLADIGFPLAGGRLDAISGRTAAALVFHRHLHAINVFIWPEAGSPPVSGSAAENGFNAVGWTQGGLRFVAVSEIPGAELASFVAEFRKRAG